MDKKEYYFSQKLGESSRVSSKRSGVSYGTLIIIVCSIFVLVLLFSKWSSISNFFGGRGDGIEVKNGETLYIGDTVELTGTLSDDGDLIIYTHKLYTSEYGFLGVRSRTVNLMLYSGEVFVKGTVEAIQGSLPILELTSLVAPEIVEDTGSVMPLGQYIGQAGLYLPPEFFSNYSLDTYGVNGEIKLTSLSTNALVTVNYFLCTSSDTNKDCSSLTKNFSASPEKTFSNAWGVTFYKLPEIQSWYFSNGTRYGYFINGVSEEEVRALGIYLTLPNEYYINQYIKPNISQICRQGDSVWESTTATSILSQNGNLVLEVKGTMQGTPVVCMVDIDPSTTFGGILMSITQQTGTPTDIATTTPTTISPVSLDPSVAQFPVRSDKTLSFTSRRGHIVVLPSTNLSFKEINEDIDFDQAGVHCFASLNVIKYEKDETLKDQLISTNPSVKVHECTVKKGFTAANNMIYTTIGDKHFVIEILDSAWVSFANAISIGI